MTVDEALAKAEWIGDQYTDLQIIALHGQFALASTVLAAEVRRLRRDCAEAYQCVGYMRVDELSPQDSEFVRLLDNLSAATCGIARPHDDLLPWPKS